MDQENRRSVTMTGGLATGVGIVTIVCATLGLLYTAHHLAFSVAGGFADLVREHGMTWFYPAFYAMSAICVACYTVLLWAGYRLARRRMSASRVLIGVWLFEIGYFLGLGLSWHIPDLGMSIAGASGVANGGLMAQFFILLPLWGPPTVFWLRRRHAAPSA
jgi:hypothetical protein